mgnify:CR=1 FL=1
MNEEFENTAPDAEESFAELLESYSAGMNENIQVGDQIRGRIISIGASNVFVDTGTKVLDAIVAELETRGFEVTVNDGSSRVKGRTLDYRREVDAALIIADVVN